MTMIDDDRMIVGSIARVRRPRRGYAVIAVLYFVVLQKNLHYASVTRQALGPGCSHGHPI